MAQAAHNRHDMGSDPRTLGNTRQDTLRHKTAVLWHGWLVSEQTNDDELDPFPPMPWGASPPDQDIITGFAYLPSSQLALIKDLVLIFGYCDLPTYLYHSFFRIWATSRTKYVLRCERYKGKIFPHNNAISSEALETCQVPLKSCFIY